ncbi:MAG: hypothetical protein KGM24_11895 [Elusimicrobia bacterium]|nr:hypothetical protein [Elusimicrobiota bacterium]
MTRLDQFKDQWPVVVFGAVTAAMVFGFLARSGGELGRARTIYRPMAGFTGDFDAASSSGNSAGIGRGASESAAALGLMSEAVQGAYPPVQATEVLRSISSLVRPRSRPREAHVGRHVRQAKAIKAPPKKSVPPPSKSPPARPAAPAAPQDTWDSVSDLFDADPAVYPLAKTAVTGGVALRLVGLSRHKRRCILKVEISNESPDDFFVRSLSVSDGRGDLEPESFVRLFIEAGRSRDAFVVFDVPPKGAQIHAALKEDKEKGRTIALTVPYPF